MTTLSLNDKQLIAVFDGLQLLTSQLYAGAGLNMASPVLCSHLLEQMYPHVVEAMARLTQVDQTDSPQIQTSDYIGQ